jgi:penicillin-binding protein 1A
VDENMMSDRTRPGERCSSAVRPRLSRLLARLGIAASILICLLLGSLAGAVGFLGKELPSPSDLQKYKPKLGTKLYDINENLICEFSEERRTLVPLTRIPRTLVSATIALEDRRFYRHWGIDLIGVARATLNNLRHGRVVQGASTITQQLARNMFLTLERTASRKLKEALLALQIERVYSKDEILEMYYNQIYFGHGAYGAQAAAMLYFGKNVEDLTLPECALLAGLPKAPATYSPFDHPNTAIRRRNLVLEAMVQAEAITRAEADGAKQAPLSLNPKPIGSNEAPYFVEEVRKYLEDHYGGNLIYQGGMVVHTTLDLRLQKIANRALEDWLLQLERAYKFKPARVAVVLPPSRAASSPEARTPYLQGALVALDPRSGQIRALIGGRDFTTSKFNRATQAQRQAGSAFKPFVYVAAMDDGFTPASVIDDSPISRDDGSGKLWTPSNYDNQFEGPTLLRRGLALSRNIVAVKLQERLGTSTVIDYARRMGIRSPLPSVPSLGLGSADVTLLEMTSAYGVIANQGIRVEPISVLRVVDRDGNLMEENFPSSETVLRPQTAFIMTSLMESVLDQGTATSARARGFTRQAAGKTGTTNDYTDAWFIGFTPGVVCGVWVGFDQKRTIVPGATGASFALPAWTEFMKEATAGQAVESFAVPEGIATRTICAQSGLLATEFCPHVRNEVFIQGTEPTESCDLHGYRKARTVPENELQWGR